MAGGTGSSGMPLLLKVRFLIEDFLELFVKPKRRAISKAVNTVYSEERANQVSQAFVLSAIEHLSAISHHIQEHDGNIQVDKQTFEALLALDHLACDLCDKLVGPQKPKT